MATRVGINGFGRIGRLSLRAAWDWPDLQIVHINEPHGDAETLAHLLEFDSVHGRWDQDISWQSSGLLVSGKHISLSSCSTPAEIPGQLPMWTLSLRQVASSELVACCRRISQEHRER